MKRNCNAAMFGLLAASLLLARGSLLLGEEIPAKSSIGIVTPAMPENPPAGWLTYHLAHPGPGGTYPADPNAAILWKDKYHLHYIYQYGDKYTHSYAHVESDDLVHWRWRPTELARPFAKHDYFSGTAFLTKEGKPAIIYHGQGSRFNQISIALDDNLDKWTPPEKIEATTPDGKPSKIVWWDPDCWVNNDTYYAISGGKPAMLIKSKDLKTWTDLGTLLHDDYPTTLGVSKNEDISCANMFKLGDKWFLLCISHGLGCRYYIGDFKDEKFLPEFHGRMNWRGQEFFAPESILTKDGRRVMWAWMRVRTAQPTQGGVQSLPRELSLPADGVLRIKPLKELETLRGEAKKLENVAVNSGANPALEGMTGDAMELAVSFQPNTAKNFGVRVLCNDKGEGGLAVKYDPAAKALFLDNLKVPFELKPDEELKLRIFVDKTVVEVFANDREAAVAGCPAPGGLGVSLFADGGEATAESVECWQMKSIY